MTRGRKLALAVGTACLVLIAVLMAIGPPRPAHGGGPAVTPPAASPFSLQVLGDPGRQVSLSQYAGRPVLINFFASDCAICRTETPMLARFYRAHGGHVAVVGIDVADLASAALGLVRRDGVGYPVGADPTASAASRYGVIALPQTLFLDAGHRIVKQIFGAVSPTDLSTGLALIR